MYNSSLRRKGISDWSTSYPGGDTCNSDIVMSQSSQVTKLHGSGNFKGEVRVSSVMEEIPIVSEGNEEEERIWNLEE